MNVLFVSHSAVVDLYQDKIYWMAQNSDVNLSLLIPERYLEGPRVTEGFTGWGGYQVIRKKTVAGERGKQNLYWYRDARGLVQSLRPDIIHLDEEPESLSSRQIIRQALGLQKKPKIVLFTWRNLPILPPSIPSLHPKRLVQESNERFCLHHSDAMIAGNHEAVDLFRAKGYSKPMPVIPQYGIDPKRFFQDQEARNRVRHSLGIQQSEVVVGFVGRMMAMKGVDCLLRAALQCRQNGAAFRLVLIGSGPELQSFKSLAGQLNLDDICTWIDGVKAAEVPAYMNSFDIATIPSLTTETWKEQFGRVIIEAMACGVPVLGSDSGEIPHVIGNGGLTAPEGQPEAWATTLQSLIRDASLRTALGEAGKQRTLALYTNQSIAEQTISVWQSLL